MKRFLELIKEAEARALKPIYSSTALMHGPFWYSVHTNSIKNRYNDSVVTNVNETTAKEIIPSLKDTRS